MILIRSAPALLVALVLALAGGPSGCDGPGGGGGAGGVIGKPVGSGGDAVAGDGGGDGAGGGDVEGDGGSESDGTTPEPGADGAAEPEPGPGPGAEPEPIPSIEDLVDPGCVDGAWQEPPVNKNGDLAAHKAAFAQLGGKGFVKAVLGVRYPVGKHLVETALAGNQNDCVQTFGDLSSADKAIGSLSTVVHECGHMADFGAGDFGPQGFSAGYILTDELTIQCPGGGSDDTFARSEIKQDAWAQLHPPCASFGAPGDCDSYAAVYLDDGFSGSQGFDTLVEEAVQYVNSLAVGYAFEDHYVWTSSERDGILTFLWYLERYLQRARLVHPEVYEALMARSCWREVVLSVWGRAWHYLALTEGSNVLGIDDAFLLGLVTESSLLDEIEYVRERHDCD